MSSPADQSTSSRLMPEDGEIDAATNHGTNESDGIGGIMEEISLDQPSSPAFPLDSADDKPKADTAADAMADPTAPHMPISPIAPPTPNQWLNLMVAEKRVRAVCFIALFIIIILRCHPMI